MIFLISILGLFFVSFGFVMFSVTFEQRVGPLLGLPGQKNEILTFLGIGMGGVLVALQALMSYIRAKAMEDTANAQIKAAEQQAIAVIAKHPTRSTAGTPFLNGSDCESASLINRKHRKRSTTGIA